MEVRAPPRMFVQSGIFKSRNHIIFELFQILKCLYVFCVFLFNSSFCPFQSSSAQPCPHGTYGSITSLSTSVCSGFCTPGIFYGLSNRYEYGELNCFCCLRLFTICCAGFFGSDLGLSTAQCSGPCSAGIRFIDILFCIMIVTVLPSSVLIV